MYDGVAASAFGARRVARGRHTSTRGRRARARLDATRRARDSSDDSSRAVALETSSASTRVEFRIESNDTTMGVDAPDDATSRDATRRRRRRRASDAATVMMSIAVMAASSLMTLGIKRGVEGRGSSALATPFKAALGQTRMAHSTWERK